jgi:hypothetical protein
MFLFVHIQMLIDDNFDTSSTVICSHLIKLQTYTVQFIDSSSNHHIFGFLGNMSAVIFIAAAILPLILSLPCMNAVCGCNFPSNNFIASSSSSVKVASALPSLPLTILPSPFFRSMVQTTGGCLSLKNLTP